MSSESLPHKSINQSLIYYPLLFSYREGTDMIRILMVVTVTVGKRGQGGDVLYDDPSIMRGYLL